MDLFDRDPWRPSGTTPNLRTAVLVVGGILDEHEAPALAAAIGAELACGPTDLTLDLSHVSEIDSAGLAVLINGLKRAEALGGTIRLVRPANDEAMRVFRLTRLDDVFSLTPPG